MAAIAATSGLKVLEHLAYNVFLPPKLPQQEQDEVLQRSIDLAIVKSTAHASRKFSDNSSLSAQWGHIEWMLKRLYKYVEAPLEKSQLYKDMKSMEPEGFLALYIRAQNAGLIIRKQVDHTTFEVFEVQAQTTKVMSIPGKIVRHFPGPMVKIPNSVAGDSDFIMEVANILSQMNIEYFDEAHPKTRKAGNEVNESRDSINPNYFIQFFFGFLCGMGTTIDPPRITKRLADEVLCMDAKNPWRRSPIWLIIRVALQTSVDSKTTYKHFMVYHHMCILSQCLNHKSFSSDLLYAMRIKMARRLYKVKDSAPRFLIDVTKTTAERIQDLLQGRWDMIQAAQAQSPNRDFSGVDFESAMHHTLPNSRSYLEGVFKPHSSNDNSTEFTPKHHPRLENINEFSEYTDGALSLAFQNDPHLALFDFEASVFDNLSSWTRRQSNYSRACATLFSCFHQYLKLARSYYTADVADLSIMVLTLMRIWMAIDELAAKDCPLLSNYSPELPTDILDPLLLRTAQHIEQACCIQQYIDARREIQRMSHEYSYTNGLQNHDRWRCERCKKDNERSGLQIQPYEWPLPSDELRAQIVVFELERPESFTIWRDLTYEILIDFGTRSAREECTQYTTLEGYDPLDPWLSIPATAPRVTIASATKSFMRSHYSGTPRVPTTESEVCLNNALQFKLYDKKGEAWAAGPFQDITFAKFGTLKLPPNSIYRHLEYTLQRTSHTSNQVLADQHDCPKELSLHEHIAFGSLRSGARLQWMNIVRGLEEDLLTFSSDEVWLLHNQAAWQLGPLVYYRSREWHEDLSDVEFGYLLVSQCRRVLSRVKASWLQVNSVLTIVILVSRLLASLPSPGVARAACNFLRETREVTYTWLGDLLVKLQNATQEDDITSYQRRVCSIAAICRATYDVDPAYIDCLLSTPKDYAALVKCSIALYDNQPSEVKMAPMSLRILLCRDRRFAHKLSLYTLAAICRGDDILSAPLSEIWPGYRKGPIGWRALAHSNNRWATTTTSGTNGGRVQRIHLNLLSGELLIDAKPLGRLPRQYVEHPTYIRLFGEKILDVVPAKSVGMVFATKVQIHDYQVSFALETTDNRLIIQAQKDDRLYELVPHEQLLDDFPLFLTEDYHHWVNLENKSMEFRPRSYPWCTDHCQWLLQLDDSGKTTLRNKTDSTFLLNIHSPAFKSLSRSICPLESNRYLHFTRSVDGLVELELPRMRLSFFINRDSQLESRNFRGQVLDENQSAGTLFGLKNQLLLRSKGAVTQSLPRSRSVLIPDGDIEYMAYAHHVSVSIRFDSRRDVCVYRYKIDEDLGCLSTDGGLTSRLFKIYLHALTSNCLPDPLTGWTGTEGALHELSQASSSSFEQINVKQAGLLKAIGLLTPKREYYPAHLKCMQRIHWLNLPSLSQHFGFSFAAAAVLRRADVLQIFHPVDFKLEECITVLETPDTLLKRATRRMAMYYPSDTTGCVLHIMGSTKALDNVYAGRDSLTGDWEEAGQASRWASSLVYQKWGNPVYQSYDLVALAKSWDILHDTNELKALSYSSDWFRIRLESSWISLYNLLRHARNNSNKYILAACLASVAFGKTLSTDLVLVFLAFATNPEFQDLDPPSQRRFEFENGYTPTTERVERLVSAFARPVESSPARDLARKVGEMDYELYLRRVNYYNSNLPNHRSQFVKNFMNQWPRTDPQPSVQLHPPNSEHSQWFFIQSCLESTREYFLSCIWNIKIRDHLRAVERVLSPPSTFVGTSFRCIPQKGMDPLVASPVSSDPWNRFNVSALMRFRHAPEPADIILFSKFSVSRRIRKSTDTSRLGNLFSEFRHSQNPLSRQYAVDLEKSRLELNAKPSMSLPRQLSSATITDLEQIRERCMSNLDSEFRHLNSVLSPQTDIERVISVAGVWPRVTSRTILQQLSFKNRSHLDLLPKWKDQLIGFAQVFADYQRSQRLVEIAESKNAEEFYRELDLASSESDPGLDDPDWLLVQIDGNFGARSVQRRVAQEMVSPSSKSNTVLQLNMGEGKSSVIVPIIASSLADSSRLVRVIVLKPLWRQMFEMLVSRLSGLANRRIYYLPFGRHIRLDSSLPNLKKLEKLYEECMREGGILLAQPEHLLSFKLMGIDRVITNSSPEVACALWKMQRWLQTHARDILDESDEILHVRYQLVYTIGEQQPLDGHPDRWTTTQQLLRLAAIHTENLQRDYPNSLAYNCGDNGQFPMLRIMPDCPAEVERKLILAIAKDVRDGGLLNLSCNRLSPHIRNRLIELFTNNKLPFPEYESMRHNCDPMMWKGLLLVRGLLASGILVFVLKNKHYRVDYGLDTSRSLVAVPYCAKDIPSLRAEFGHPDISVVLTCFSYYYHGLTHDQLEFCFDLLFKLDNPSLEYEQWVKRNENIPNDLEQLNGVNIKDRQQFTERLVPAFAHNSATIDFFLSSVVFPKAAKAFPPKTIDISGTNDNRYLLPTSISQADPLKQLSTSALVINYLLEPENNHYVCMRNEKGQFPSTKGFLELLVSQKPEVRVLLDVGAQMLELKNEPLVRCWLDLVGSKPEVEAAVYFNDRDELVVLPQNGTPVPFNTSPFAQRLDKCLVYLDDGHTRGTDLKLPRDARALVTLGPKVTKDRLLQGCMRMRKLGHGQSVMFAAPPEIDNQIRSASPNPISPNAPIGALDVLRWSMLQTCKDLQHHVSHWAQQGIEYTRRHNAEMEYENTRCPTELEDGWTSPECHPLETMYGVISHESLSGKPSFTQRAFEVSELRNSLLHLGITELEETRMDEEQEREFDPEVEREEATQNPPKRDPMNPSIHPALEYFIRTGNLDITESGIIPIFRPFRGSHPSVYHGWSDLLFASADFFQTIEGLATDGLNEYMRPVNWILSGPGNIRIVLSPYEVNHLLPLIRKGSLTRLHVYAPRVSLAMRSFSDLQFYSIPPSPKGSAPIVGLSISQLQLDLFAGQLYLPSYQDYVSLCATLGLFIPSDSEDDPCIKVGSDGFVDPEHRNRLVLHYKRHSICRFKATPIPALNDLIGLRRKGMKYLLTHVGQILHGRSLTPQDFPEVVRISVSVFHSIPDWISLGHLMTL
ncbi:hypothetical protein OPQ81_011915 [Rhizoctonia solani]|nr:hypothetical protein OPQ81_011915 [Rhizoctonia solani]